MWLAWSQYPEWSQGSLLLTWINLNPSINFNGTTSVFCEWISNLTPHITGHVISVTYPYRELGFKLIHDVRRRGPCNESSWLSVPCLREWLGLPAYESIEIMICHLSGIGISIIKIRYQYHKTQVYIDLSVRWHLYIETDSRGLVHERFSHRNFNPMETWF